MTDTTYNVINPNRRSDQGMDQRRAARRRRTPAVSECRAVAVHLQVGGGDGWSESVIEYIRALGADGVSEPNRSGRANARPAFRR